MRIEIPLVFSLASATAIGIGSLFKAKDDLFVSTPNLNEKVPGDSPIQTCLDDEPQLVAIDKVDIFPNPPIPGTNLTITASGELKTDIVDGSYVDVLVKYGFIILVNKRYDLCELMPEVDLECPIKKGYLRLERTVLIPEEVPPGKYYVEAQAYTPRDELLTCLTGEVTIE